MSTTLTNLTISSFPTRQRRTSSARFPSSLRPSNSATINSMARAEGRDSLEHLQRQSQLQPKKKNQQAAPIGLWDRFPTARTVQQMMDTMERMIDDPFAYTDNWASTLPREDVGRYRRGRTPWEIKEGENEYKMRFDMPGMTRNDVKLYVEDKMLVVKAEKVTKKTENGEEVEEEWSANTYGRYSSRIALPENVVFDQIKAEVKDGVLYIAIPKASASSKILDIDVQ